MPYDFCRIPLKWRRVDVITDNLSSGFDWTLLAEVELVVADIADQKSIEHTMKRRGVAAIAGSVIVPESVTDPLGYHLNNTVNRARSSNPLVKVGAPSSTAAVEGSPKRLP